MTGGLDETGLEEGVGPVLLKAACCWSGEALVTERVSLATRIPPAAGTAKKHRLKPLIGGLSALWSDSLNIPLTTKLRTVDVSRLMSTRKEFKSCVVLGRSQSSATT